MPGTIEQTLGRGLTKLLFALPLMYAVFIIYYCPCIERLICCHLTLFFSLLALGALLVLFENDGSITDTCIPAVKIPIPFIH